MARDAELAGAPNADDERVRADADAADGADAPGGNFGVGFKGPGEGTWWACEIGDVGGGAGEDLVACHAAGGCVDKV